MFPFQKQQVFFTILKVIHKHFSFYSHLTIIPLFPFLFFYCRFLEFFPPSIEFVVASIAIRAVHATGNAFVITATFTYAAGAFDKSVGTVFVRIYYHHLLILPNNIYLKYYKNSNDSRTFVIFGQIGPVSAVLKKCRVFIRKYV